MGFLIKIAEYLASLGGEGEHDLAAIIGRGLTADEFLRSEVLHDTAQVTSIETKNVADLTCRHRFAGAQFEQHPCLGQGKRAGQESSPSTPICRV